MPIAVIVASAPAGGGSGTYAKPSHCRLVFPPFCRIFLVPPEHGEADQAGSDDRRDSEQKQPNLIVQHLDLL
ncbi:MAG TPA: hypothetical protein VGV39_09345 [Mesorhizobium sp.]|jgi:hypothetical protein|uniref:hypothetical protein n=1 Tax=Mesorhizobium sp. TaxID=1871066 RepID=UPI002DDD4375|nr:hypothetical protein [Mesorhizobium sp.]HEV2503270.1 hypothetical protein [Mesorhizobium sp.]